MVSLGCGGRKGDTNQCQTKPTGGGQTVQTTAREITQPSHLVFCRVHWQLVMAASTIVTCTAPVNIAVIKYCKEEP